MTQTILITGASSGIGKATAQHFRQHGWNVAATMRSPERSDLGQDERLVTTRLDVTDLDSIEAAVAVTIDRFGRVDALVNNAGYGTLGALEAIPRDAMLRQLNTNLVGVLDVTRAVLPHMRKQGEGVIINVSSVGGKITFPFNSLYHAAKFGLEGATESLAFELGSIGIRVKIIQPGSIATDFLGRSVETHDNPDIAEYRPGMDLIHRALEQRRANPGTGSPPSAVAEVIYTAATDGTDGSAIPPATTPLTSSPCATARPTRNTSQPHASNLGSKLQESSRRVSSRSASSSGGRRGRPSRPAGAAS